MYIELILGWIFIVMGFFMVIFSFSKNSKKFSEILLFAVGLCLLLYGHFIVVDYTKLNKDTVAPTQLSEPKFR